MNTILFSSDTSNRGGKERQLTLLATGLIQRGYRVYIAVKRIQSDNNYFAEYNLPDKNIYIYNGFNQFTKIIAELRPDVAVSWDIKSSLYHLLIYRIYKYHFINGSIRHGIRLFKLSHLWRSMLAWLSPFVIANSRAGLIANNMKPGRRRYVIHNGIENKFNKTKTTFEKKELLSELFPNYVSEPAPVFISVANFVPYKDYFTVIGALKKLKNNKQFYYLMIGDGPLRTNIIRLIKEFGLDKYVKILGVVNNVEDYLAVSDYYIHSSRGEGMSNAILEAMYAGLPVVATDVGGVRETVYKESSVLFPYREEEKLFEILLHVEDIFKHFDPAADSYRNHLASFSIDCMISNYERIIRNMNQNN